MRDISGFGKKEIKRKNDINTKTKEAFELRIGIKYFRLIISLILLLRSNNNNDSVIKTGTNTAAVYFQNKSGFSGKNKELLK